MTRKFSLSYLKEVLLIMKNINLQLFEIFRLMSYSNEITNDVDCLHILTNWKIVYSFKPGSRIIAKQSPIVFNA